MIMKDLRNVTPSLGARRIFHRDHPERCQLSEKDCAERGLPGKYTSTGRQIVCDTAISVLQAKHPEKWEKYEVRAKIAAEAIANPALEVSEDVRLE